MRRPRAAPHTAVFLLWLAVGGLASLGLFGSADRFLYDQRFAARTQAVTGERVFVAIDAPSLAAVGLWPWPRTIHAWILDTLLDAGVHEIVFDIDFSALSSPESDAALVRALERAGGYAYLAAFTQTIGDGAMHLSMPAPIFGAHADMINMNVILDEDGIPRSVPYGIVAGDTVVPTLAALSLRQGSAMREIPIDYGIRAETILTFSALDILERQFAPEALRGKTVVIGASALELQDIFRSPNQGPLPGAVVQILAAETAAQHRIVRDLGVGPALMILAVFLIGFGLWGRRGSFLSAWLVIATTATVAEIVAVALYTSAATMIATMPLHTGLAGFGLLQLLRETRLLQYIVERLQGERARMRQILDRVVADNFDGIVIVSSQWRILSASVYAENWLGRQLVSADASSVLPEPFVRALQKAFDTEGMGERTSNPVTETTVERPDGSAVAEYVVTISRIALPAGEAQATACLTFRDITTRKASEDRLRYLAEHDDLTGALKRESFIRLLDGAIATQHRVHVLAFDLRRLSAITATLGHEIADELLRQAVQRLQDAGYVHLARLGGSSFALAVFNGDGEGDDLFAPVGNLLGQPFKVREHFVTVGFAGGWASEAASSGASLLRQANLALVEVRSAAGNPLASYDPSQEKALAERQLLDGQIRAALQDRQFELAFQPQLSANDMRLVGAEALLRWHHPDRGPVSPQIFLPIAEETGLIAEIGRMVLDRACMEALCWPGDIRVAVNVSPVQFELCDMFAEVTSALERTGLPAERLELEITEGLLLRQRDRAVNTLRKLSALGVMIAIDDFGTGFSSLSYISNLPFDALKIDKSFVDAMFDNRAAMSVVESVIALGRQLDKTVVAEGVETQEQAETLAALGCTVFQGYLYGRPTTPAEINALAMSQACPACPPTRHFPISTQSVRSSNG